MKKIFLTLLILAFMGNVALAQEQKQHSFKNFFNKSSIPTQTPSSDDEYSPSKQATLFYNSGDSKKALDVLLKISEDNRTDLDWLILGNILQDQGKASDALFMYQRAALVNPKFYKAYYNMGNIYLADEKPFMAIDSYKKSIHAKGDFAYAYYNLGCAYIQAGELKKAKLAFIKAIEIKNTEPAFHYNLAYTYKKLNKPKLSKQYLEFYNKLMNSISE